MISILLEKEIDIIAAKGSTNEIVSMMKNTWMSSLETEKDLLTVAVTLKLPSLSP